MPTRLYHEVTVFCSCLWLLVLHIWGQSMLMAPLTSCRHSCSEVFGRLPGAKGLCHTQLSVAAATTG